MNIRRGLFRLWIVGTAAWALFMIFNTYEKVANPWMEPLYYRYVEGGSAVPMDMFQAVMLDSSYAKADIGNRVEIYVPRNADKAVLKAYLPEFKRLYVESRTAEVRWLQAKWAGVLLAIIAVPALGGLLVGWALIWAFSGFKRALP